VRCLFKGRQRRNSLTSHTNFIIYVKGRGLEALIKIILRLKIT
jgi:hypothetical protein